MTQPTDDPTFATDDDYTSGTDTGVPNKLAPSTGLRAQGLSRDDYYPVRVMNHVLHVHGAHLAGIIDKAALNWSQRTVSVGTSLDGATSNGASTPPGPVVDTLVGGYLSEDVLVCMNPTSPKYSRNGKEWVNMGAHGIGAPARGPICGLAGGTTPNVVVFDGDSGSGLAVVKSVIGGAFLAAGTIDGDMTHGIYSPTLDRWFICGCESATTATVHVSDDLANSAWPTLTIPAEWNGALFAPTCIAQGTAGVAIGLGSGGGVVFTPDGANLTVVTVDGLSAVVGLCFSEAHQKWYALLGDATVWMAPADMASWSEVGSVSRSGFTTIGTPGANQKLLQAFGRALIAGGENDGLSVSLDGGATWRLIVRFVDATRATAWMCLVPWQGRLVAAAATDFNEVEAADANNLALIMSDVAPFAFEESGL